MIDHGTYVEHDGRPAVRFTRRYPHSAERVWAAVSEPAGLRHWFPSRVELEPRVGGRIVFRDDPNVFVAGDLLWYPVEGDPKTRMAPDTMVAFGRPKGYRGSYKQWVEGGSRPIVSGTRFSYTISV